MPLAHLLRDDREAILHEWELEVRRSSSKSTSLSSVDLRDDMPAFLDRLADWLDSGSTNTADAVGSDTTGKHALHRLQHGVELRDLIHEYRLLRQVVLKRAVARGETEELQRNLTRFADAVDHAMTESVATYANARDEAREMMLAVLSHDLRTPLTTISMAATAMLKAGRLNPPEVRAASRIARSADLIARMISDLLDLARSRFGGSMPIHPVTLDLAEVAYYGVEELQLAHPDRTIEFVSRGDVHGRWDRDRMTQLVSNLVGNAVRHGRDPIHVVVRELDGEIEIRVTNRGPAIPTELIPALFEPYRRGEHANGIGLGLGLFIVAEIVRAHGGTVSVASNEKETTFCVRLPKNATEPAREEEDASVHPPPAPAHD